MGDIEQQVRARAHQRVAELFRVQADSLGLDATFGEELKATFVSDFKNNEFDLIDRDIRDVADRATLKRLGRGELEIRTVRDYCEHMVRSYQTNPQDVTRVLQIRL